MIDLRLAVHQYIIGRKFAVAVKFPMIFRDFPTSYRCKFGEFFSKRTFSPHYKISLPCYHGTVFIFSSLKAKKANHTTFHSENMAKFHGHKSTKGQIILLLPLRNSENYRHFYSRSVVKIQQPLLDGVGSSGPVTPGLDVLRLEQSQKYRDPPMRRLEAIEALRGLGFVTSSLVVQC